MNTWLHHLSIPFINISITFRLRAAASEPVRYN